MDIYSKKMINVIIYLYQHTTPPFCLPTAGVLPITSQRFGDIVREKSDMFYIGQLSSYDKKLYNFQRHTSNKNRRILSSDNIVRFLSLIWHQLYGSRVRTTTIFHWLPV